MSAGVELAATYYDPDGALPSGGWPAVLLLHGIGETRTFTNNAVGMSINTIAETYLVPQGYAALTFDARGHGESGGVVDIDGPREVQEVRELVAWLGSRPNVASQHIGAFGYSYGGGALWRAAGEGVPFAALEIETSWTDLFQALSPGGLARSGIVLGFWQSIQQRASPELPAIVNDILGGQNPATVRDFAAQRSSRQLLDRITVPTFLMQGRRDFAFDLDQALIPFA